MACVELRREIGNSAALRPFAKREVMPGHLNRADLENFATGGVTVLVADVLDRQDAR